MKDMEYTHDFPKHYKNQSLDDIPGEVWRDIPDFAGKYLVSNMGRIKVLNRQNRGYPEIMKLNTSGNKSGYLLIQLYKNNQPFTMQVHRIVANVFIPNPHNWPEVNHIKGFKLDNRASELQWCTRLQNIRHAYKTLGVNSGINHFRAKLNAEIIQHILTTDLTQRELGKIYQVSHSTIGMIRRNKSYKEIINGFNK
jgi:hypothetical protein